MLPKKIWLDPTCTWIRTEQKTKITAHIIIGCSLQLSPNIILHVTHIATCLVCGVITFCSAEVHVEAVLSVCSTMKFALEDWTVQTCRNKPFSCDSTCVPWMSLLLLDCLSAILVCWALIGLSTSSAPRMSEVTDACDRLLWDEWLPLSKRLLKSILKRWNGNSEIDDSKLTVPHSILCLYSVSSDLSLENDWREQSPIVEFFLLSGHVQWKLNWYFTVVTFKTNNTIVSDFCQTMTFLSWDDLKWDLPPIPSVLKRSLNNHDIMRSAPPHIKDSSWLRLTMINWLW